jgi:hypothetical protein|tara:strand:- start:1196 stop:1369 length:174 start_codon:yes stop_codon:yes gene_type:complete
MEYWKHPSQGKIESFEDDKHPEKKEQLQSLGWFKIKGRDDWSPFQAKKSFKKKKKKK